MRPDYYLPYWVLMTRDVIPNSRKILERELLKSGYRAPRILEAAIFIMVQYVRSGTRLYSDNLCTYTICKETTYGNSIAVGNFSSNDLTIDEMPFPSYKYGIGALRDLTSRAI